jgi:hypothetical protein
LIFFNFNAKYALTQLKQLIAQTVDFARQNLDKRVDYGNENGIKRY